VFNAYVAQALALMPEAEVGEPLPNVSVPCDISHDAFTIMYQDVDDFVTVNLHDIEYLDLSHEELGRTLYLARNDMGRFDCATDAEFEIDEACRRSSNAATRVSE
jgi:hypothetical protein